MHSIILCFQILLIVVGLSPSGQMIIDDRLRDSLHNRRGGLVARGWKNLYFRLAHDNLMSKKEFDRLKQADEENTNVDGWWKALKN
jgi:hypothetical protein